MVGHWTTPTMDFRGKNLEKKYFYLGENPAVVKLPLYDDLTTGQFLAKISYFKMNELPKQALKILFKLW